MKKASLRQKRLSPVQQIALSFLAVIVIGSLLLSLPIANKGETIPYLDHLFTATSATCVTGLISVVVADQYSIFGQIVIICLIQIGGLGFLTLFHLLMVLMHQKLSYTNKLILQEALNQDSIASMSLYLKRVFRYTLFFEAIGALLLSIVFIDEYGFLKGIYYGIFHSISAFCNAGFDILGSQSLIPYQDHVLVNLTIGGLIIAGGLGFIVWITLKDYLIKNKKEIFHRHFLSRLPLHVKIVLIMTISLLCIGTLGFLCLEYHNPLTIGQLDLPHKLLASFFQSITLRTAGFASVSMADLYQSTKLFCSILMFIGGSPAGTAGGIKTTTFLIVLIYLKTMIKGEETFKIMHRCISDQLAKRALTITLISFLISIIALLILSICESQVAFIDLIFEVYSAFGTVGLTAGLTPQLSTVSKCIIMILMYMGRIGPLTMVLVFTKRYHLKKGKDIIYPDGEILIG